MERDLQLSLVSSKHNNDNHDGTIYAAMYVGLYPDCFMMSGICTSQQQCLQKTDCKSVLCSVGCDGQLPKETLSQLKQVLTSPFSTQSRKYMNMSTLQLMLIATVHLNSELQPLLRYVLSEQ